MRGGARRPHARRTPLGGGGRGAGDPGERERATLSVRLRAPYLRRWAFFSSLLREIGEEAGRGADALEEVVQAQVLVGAVLAVIGVGVGQHERRQPEEGGGGPEGR